MVDDAPTTIGEALSREDADAMKAKLEEAGGDVELK
jgi:large subunit ribosomal protein L7/L12